MRFLVLLFITVPLLELYLLVWLSRETSLSTTVVLTLVTGVAGSWLARREGLKAWRQWRNSLDALQAPEIGLIEGLLILIGGALLITPGVLTDLVGLSLLLPWTRKHLAGYVKKRATLYIESHTVVLRPGGEARPASTRKVIESVGEPVDDDERRQTTHDE